MTNAQKIQLRLSEVRGRLNAISGLAGDAFTSEIKSEASSLQSEYGDLEIRHRAAIVADETTETTTEGPDAEARERLELRGKARVGDFVASALTGRGVTGASAEFADSVGCAGLMPLELLDAPGEIETRAVTPGPSAETAVTSTRPTVPFAFSRTDAAALGISMPALPPGESHHVALTTAPPAGPKAKDAAAASTAAAFSLTKRVPKRITGAFMVRVEDLSLLPSMENDLRTAISARMADSLDAQVIGGDGSGANLDGLFNQATAVGVASDTETFTSAIVRLAGLVDGKHANGFGDIRALIGVQTFAKFAAIFANSDKGDISAYDHLMSKLGGLRVSVRAPAVASMGQKAIAVLGAQGQPIVVPVWKGVELIVDPYTQAAKGQRIVTAVSLVGSPFIPYGVAQVVAFTPKLS